MRRKLLILREVVGAKGFEPSTSWSRTRRASQAALRPDNLQRHSNASPQGTLEYHSNVASATDHSLRCPLAKTELNQWCP
jgi:hypothetical protein